MNFCRQILLASEIVVLVGIIMSFHFTHSYSVPQYVCSALVTFVAAEVLEGEHYFYFKENKHYVYIFCSLDFFALRYSISNVNRHTLVFVVERVFFWLLLNQFLSSCGFDVNLHNL